VTGLTTGQAYHFTVTATNAIGTRAASVSSNVVTLTAPAGPAIGAATAASNASATVRWTAPAPGGSAITGYSVRVLNAANGQVGLLRPSAAGTSSLVVTALTAGQTYHFTVTATNAVGTSIASVNSNTVPLVVVGTAVIGTAVAGTVGGALTATANWTAPAATAGNPVTGYVVRALRLNAAGTVLATVTSAPQAATARSLSMTLPAGNYRFTVQASNALGAGAQSGRSNLVAAR